VRLTANFCNPPRQLDVLIVPVHTSERVTGQGAGRRLPPSHNDARVQPAGERDSNLLVPIKIAGSLRTKTSRNWA